MGARYGHKVSEETREKIRRSLLGRPSPKKGKPANYSTEVLNKIRVARAKQVFTKEQIARRVLKFTGDKSPHWKGDNVGYSGLHSWITKQFGTPQKCEHCGTTENRRYQWANKSRKYNSRSPNDWVRLCIPCHRRYDLDMIKNGEPRVFPLGVS